MSAPLKSIEGTGDLAAAMAAIGRHARAAARTLALASPEQKDRALELMAAAARAQKAQILAANAEDLAEARATGLAGAFLDRLALDAARVEAMAAGIEAVRSLQDPVGRITASWTRPNGMTIERVRVPLGVIGIIYESRPNVTADAGALCRSPAMLPSCAAAPTACARAAPSMPPWRRACARPASRTPPSNRCLRATAPRSG
jgi:glutamate-5-semialdehyde dehydrogenase